MLTTWQEELWLKVQSHVTLLSKPFLPSKTLQLPPPSLQGSTPKSQSFFPSFFPISFNTSTAPFNIYYQNPIQISNHLFAFWENIRTQRKKKREFTFESWIFIEITTWVIKTSNNLFETKQMLNGLQIKNK